MTSWAGVEAADARGLLDWAEARPWGAAMRACGQDAGWHAEGDVLTHTGMVLAELERLAEWPALAESERLVLRLVALFHDAGKPATTHVDPATGRTRSPKHAQVGERIARAALRELGCPLGAREQICRLVRYHGRPPYLIDKPDPEREVAGLSWLVDHRLLYAFALADTRGRLTVGAGDARAEDALHLYKLAAQEAGCFGSPYPFGNDQARFLFYRGQLSDLRYAPREDHACTATLMCGLPGSGKDTYLMRRRPELPAVSLDALRGELDCDPAGDQGAVIQAARELCRGHLRARRDFAFNATNTVRATRARWVELFASYGARVEVVYIEPPPEVGLARNAARARPVPAGVVERLAERLEPPDWSEAHGVAFA